MKTRSLTVTLMMIIFSVTIIKAQTITGTGTGFFKSSFRKNASTPEEVIRYAKEALMGMATGNDAIIKKYYVYLPNISYADIKDLQMQHIENRLGLTNGSLTDDGMIKVINNLTFRKVGRDYWNAHTNGYLPEGESSLAWWDPRRSVVDPNKQWWVIASIKLNDGSIVDLFVADCGNPAADSEEETTTSEYDGYDETFTDAQQPPAPPAPPKPTNLNGGNYNYNYNNVTVPPSNSGQGTVNYTAPSGPVRTKPNGVEIADLIVDVVDLGLNIYNTSSRNRNGGYRNQRNYSNDRSSSRNTSQRTYSRERKSYSNNHGSTTRETRRYNNTQLSSRIATNYGGTRVRRSN